LWWPRAINRPTNRSSRRRARSDVFRGDETDVLDRYYQAARANGFDVVVRITSDCPLIDPGLIDRVVELVLDGDGRIDYAANTLRRTFPRGLDTQVAPFPALERIWREATSTFDRAHVFPYAYEHPEAFVLAGITNAVDLSGLRWTVDEEEDLAFVREVYRRLGRPDAPWTEVAALVQSHPELTAINAAVCQKTARQA
jgi:spore coat polysaccharide biosynthesis protein SpsF